MPRESNHLRQKVEEICRLAALPLVLNQLQTAAQLGVKQATLLALEPQVVPLQSATQQLGSRTLVQ